MTIKDFLQTGRNLAAYFITNSTETFNPMHFTRLVYALMDDARQKGRFDEYYYYKSIYSATEFFRAMYYTHPLYCSRPLVLYSWRFFIHCYRSYRLNLKLP